MPNPITTITRVDRRARDMLQMQAVPIARCGSAPLRPKTPGFQVKAGLVMAALSLGAVPQAAPANNYGESLAWQFKTSGDRTDQAAILDLIAKRRGGYYAAPIYTTNIAR